MLNIEGLVKITKLEDMSMKAVKGIVYFGTKRQGAKNSDGEDQWENSFFKAVLVGKAVEKSGYINDKDSIYVTSGLVKNVSYEDKNGDSRNYLSLTIFDFIYKKDEIDEKIKSLKQKEIEKTGRRNKTEQTRNTGRTRTRNQD